MGDNVLPPDRYLAILQSAGVVADLWQTTYQHVDRHAILTP
jgi:trans-aconitate methyltransferase